MKKIVQHGAALLLLFGLLLSMGCGKNEEKPTQTVPTQTQAQTAKESPVYTGEDLTTAAHLADARWKKETPTVITCAEESGQVRVIVKAEIIEEMTAVLRELRRTEAQEPMLKKNMAVSLSFESGILQLNRYGKTLFQCGNDWYSLTEEQGEQLEKLFQ